MIRIYSSGCRRCVELFRYQRMRVFGAWSRMVEHAVLIYKRFSEAKLKVYAAFIHPNLADNDWIKWFFV